MAVWQGQSVSQSMNQGDAFTTDTFDQDIESVQSRNQPIESHGPFDSSDDPQEVTWSMTAAATARRLKGTPSNPISALYQYSAKKKLSGPVYQCRDVKMLKTTVFEVSVNLPAFPDLNGTGTARVKQEAKAVASMNLLDQLYAQDESSGLSVSVEPDGAVTVSKPHVPQHPSPALKRQNPETPVSNFPEIDEKNPIPAVFGILHRVGWPNMIHEELGQCPGAQEMFEHSVYAGPADANGAPLKKYSVIGSGKNRKAARAVAVVQLYKILRDCPEFQLIYQNSRSSKSGKKQKLAVQAQPVADLPVQETPSPTADGKPYPALTEAKVYLEEALKKQPRTDSPYQSMEIKLGLVLEHMRSFARQAAWFLGAASDVKADPDGQRHIMSYSAVLEEVARKLPESNMIVEFRIVDRDPDWNKDTDVKDEERAPTNGTKKAEIDNASMKTEDKSADISPPASEVVTQDTEDSAALQSTQEKTEHVPVKTEYSADREVEVSVDVSWEEDVSRYPRQLNFKGRGASYPVARDNAAAEFFLYFGLRDEFEIFRVG